MRKLAIILATFAAPSLALDFEKLHDDYVVFFEQTDPFDEDSKRYLFLVNHAFSFKCDEISFGKRETSNYMSFLYDADIAIKIDDNEVFNTKGTNSSSQFSSSIHGFSRMYSAEISPEIIEQMKTGNKIQASGKALVGWESFSMNLRGFSKAYSLMCD